MNIWYIHHYATPDTMPGLHRPFEFGKYFLQSGHKLTVFTSSYLHYADKNVITDSSKYLEKNFNGINTIFIKTISYKNSGVRRVCNMLQFYKNVIKTAKKIYKKGNIPDIIISSSPHPFSLIAGLKISKKFNIPCVSEIRDFWPEVFFTSGKLKEKSIVGKILLTKEKEIYKKSDGIIFLKEGDVEYILEKKWDTLSSGPVDIQKCFYINNGVDIESFEYKKNNFVYDDYDLNDKTFKIIYCGTVRPINHIDLLIDVAKMLSNDDKVLIYGDGSCLEELKNKVITEKVNNVVFKGYVDNKYIPSILSKADVNILNYSADKYNWSRGNSSNKLFEYFASGKPVVSTIKMGYDMIEKYNCGISANKGDPQEIADCIKKIKCLEKNKYEQMCHNSCVAASDFDIKKLAADYLCIIEKIIKGWKKND